MDVQLTEPRQLILPGVLPINQRASFPNYKCCNAEYLYEKHPLEDLPLRWGSLCRENATLVAIYFRMGNHTGDEEDKSLAGLDCPFDDSTQIYACDEQHLTGLVKRVHTEDISDWEGNLPEIIFNARGEIERSIMKRIYSIEGKLIDDTFFTSNTCSFGRESLETFWEREKWRFVPGQD